MILWIPTARLVVVKVAVVSPLAVLSIPLPMLVEPSKKDTVPVALPPAVLPGALTLTVALKVTACPTDNGFGNEVTAVLVAARYTVGSRCHCWSGNCCRRCRSR